MSLSNTYGTTNPGAQIGNREDLAAGLSMLEPTETPVYSMLAKPKLSAMEYSWLTNALAAPSTTPTPEGAPVTSITNRMANQARLYNNVHKLGETFGVTKEQEAVDSAGPANFDESMKDTTLVIKRNIEATILGTQDKATQGGSVDAWQTRGFADWIDSDGPADVPAQYRTPAASIHASGTYTEVVLETQLGSIFSQTGKVTNINMIASVALRKAINKFFRSPTTSTDNVYHVNEDATKRTVTLNVEVYDSSFGRINIINGNPLCFPTGINGYLLNPAFADVGNLIPLGWEMLPDDGTGKSAYMDVVFGTRVKNPKAHGKIGTL